jgi:hypothetical protein
MPPRKSTERPSLPQTPGRSPSRTDGPGQVTLQDVRLIWRNFTGLQGPFNAKGDRNFNVVLPEDVAQAMAEDGWNVKWKPPWNEEDKPMPVLKVNVKYHARDGRMLRPPRVILITSRGKTPVDESMISLLDWARIETCDLIINSRAYDVNGKQGYTAYLYAIYVTIEEDELELKYSDVPDSAQGIVLGKTEEEPPF